MADDPWARERDAQWLRLAREGRLIQIGEFEYESDEERRELSARVLANARAKRARQEAARAAGATSDSDSDAGSYFEEDVPPRPPPAKRQATASRGAPSRGASAPARRRAPAASRRRSGPSGKRPASAPAAASRKRPAAAACSPSSTPSKRRGAGSIANLSIDVASRINLDGLLADLERCAAEPKGAKTPAVVEPAASQATAAPESASRAIVRASSGRAAAAKAREDLRRAAAADDDDDDYEQEDDPEPEDYYEGEERPEETRAAAGAGNASAAPKVPLKGPHIAKNEVIARLWKVKRAKDLSCDAHPLQFALLERCFEDGGPLQRASPQHGPPLFHVLADAARQIEDVMRELMAGWNRGMKRLNTNGAVKIALTDVTQDFESWYPAYWTYRYFVVPNGDHGSLHADEFFNDLFDSDRHQPTPKPHPFWAIPFYRDAAYGLLRRKGKLAPGAQPPPPPSTADAPPIWKTRAVARAKLGPLAFHEFVEAKAMLDASDEQLRARFPHAQPEAVRAQCAFDARIQAACERASNAHAYFLHPETRLFGEPVNDTLRNGTYALTSLHTNMQASVEQVQRRETWTLRLFHRFIQLQDNRMVDRSYQHVRGPPPDAGMRRVAAPLSASTVLRSGACGISDTVQALICAQLFTLLKLRWNAFNDAIKRGARLPASFVLPPPPQGIVSKATWPRTWLTQRVGMTKNAPDWFKDTNKGRTAAGTPRVRALTAAASPRLLEERAAATQTEERRRFEAFTLAFATVGIEAIVTTHEAELGDIDLDCLLPTHAGNVGECLTVAECFARAAIRYNSAKEVAAMMKEMPWLAMSARRPASAILVDVDARLREVNRALAFHQKTCDLVQVVKANFERERQRIQAQVAAARRDASVDAATRPEARQSDIDAESFNKALRQLPPRDYGSARFPLEALGVECIREWVDRDTDDGTPVRAAHAVRLREWRDALTAYKALLERSADRSNAFFDFLKGGARAEVAQLVQIKENDHGDKVDFAKLVQRGRAQYKALLPTRVRMAVNAFTTLRNQVNRRILETICVAFDAALEWANVYDPMANHVAAPALTHVNVGVSGLTLMLSIAAAYDTLSTSPDADGSCLRVFRRRDDGGAPDVRLAPIEDLDAFAKRSTTNWECVRALAVVASDVLTFKSHTRRTMSTSGLLVSTDQARVALRDDEALLTVFRGRLDESPTRLTGLKALGDTGDPVDMAARVANFPSRYDWTFADAELVTPERFLVLFSFLPSLASKDQKLYRLLGGSHGAHADTPLDMAHAANPRKRVNFYHVFNHPLSQTRATPFAAPHGMRLLPAPY